MSAHAQQASFTFFSQVGDKFWLIIDGKKINDKPSYRVEFNTSEKGGYSGNILFENRELNNINFDFQTHTPEGDISKRSYAIEKNQAGKCTLVPKYTEYFVIEKPSVKDMKNWEDYKLGEKIKDIDFTNIGIGLLAQADGLKTRKGVETIEIWDFERCASRMVCVTDDGLKINNQTDCYPDYLFAYYHLPTIDFEKDYQIEFKGKITRWNSNSGYFNFMFFSDATTSAYNSLTNETWLNNNTVNIGKRQMTNNSQTYPSNNVSAPLPSNIDPKGMHTYTIRKFGKKIYLFIDHEFLLSKEIENYGSDFGIVSYADAALITVTNFSIYLIE